MLNHDLTDVSTFRAMLARDFADTPRPAVAPTTLFAAWIDTRLGPMVTLTDKRRLHLLEFASRPDLDRQLKLHQRTLNARFAFAATAPATAIARQLAAYFTGQSMAFDCVLAEVGTTFQLHVWANLQRVPPGETRTYTDLAREAGQPKAVRAAAAANARNRCAIIIPCHRIIGRDGSLTGYAGGLARKQWLLDHEAKYSRIMTRGPVLSSP